PRHGKLHADGDDHQRRKEDAEYLFRKTLGALDAVRLYLLGKERHECGVERTFGEKPAKEVRKAEGGVEHIGHRTGSKRRRHEGFAGKAEEPAAQRRSSDGREFPDEAHRAGLEAIEKDTFCRGAPSPGLRF